MFVLIMLALSVVACGTEGAPSSDTLGQMVDAQTQATIAAAKLQGAQRVATTQAEATAQYLILQSQQTRIARDNQATATADAYRVSATGTAQAQSATARSIQATQTRSADIAFATATSVAAQYTATAQAQNANATATMQAVAVESTRVSASATSTANALIVEATKVSASATATANAANAHNTRTSAEATATVIRANVIVAEEQATWNTRMEAARSIASFAGLALVLLGGAALVGLFITKFGDAWVMRTRTVRDANGTPFILLPSDGSGRQTLLIPSRSPGGVVTVTPPDEEALQIEAGAVDAATTMRDQGIGLVMATARVDGHGPASRVVREIVETDPTTPPTADAPNVQISKPFEPKQLTLSHLAPSEMLLPIGTTDAGDEMWIPLNETTHAVIGGTSRMGKTRVLHGWIRALLRARGVRLVLYDGKEGLEFGRYSRERAVRYVDTAEVNKALCGLIDEVKQRAAQLLAYGVTSAEEYNAMVAHADVPRMYPIVAVIDELDAAQNAGNARDALDELSRRAMASNVHLFSATQRPSRDVISKDILANAPLRIALSCVSYVESAAILNSAGAEKLGGVRGRMIVQWNGKQVQLQAFQINVEPSPLQKVIAPPSAVNEIEAGAPGAAASGGVNLDGFEMTDLIREMVRYALDNHGGIFKVSVLADAFKMSNDTAVEIGKTLEARGLLSVVDKDNGHGGNVGRHITPELAGMVTGVQTPV